LIAAIKSDVSFFRRCWRLRITCGDKKMAARSIRNPRSHSARHDPESSIAFFFVYHQQDYRTTVPSLYPAVQLPSRITRSVPEGQTGPTMLLPPSTPPRKSPFSVEAPESAPSYTALHPRTLEKGYTRGSHQGPTSPYSLPEARG